MSKKLKKANQSRTLYAAVFSILFAVTGALALVFTQAAGTGKISLTADRSTLGINDTVNVTVYEESVEAVNAVQADLTYNPAVMQFISIDTNSSGFNLAVQGTGGSGKVTIARGSVGDASPRPITGRQVVGVVKFKALTPGATSIGVANTSMLLSNSSNSNILSETSGVNLTVRDSTPPTVPAGLTASGATLNSVSLRWNASTDNTAVAGYEVYRNGNKVGDVTTTSYTDTGLTQGTAYSYTVAAYDRERNLSARSPAINVSTLADTAAPSTPTGITLTANDLNTITFRWTASTDNVGVTGYNVFRNGVKIGTSTTTSFADKGLAAGGRYTYSLSAYDARGNTSAQSTGVALSTKSDSVAPTTPGGLKVTAASATSANLSWSASSDNIGVEGYEIYRNNILIATINSNTYTDRSLTPDTTYQYKIQAKDAAGNKSTAASASVTVRYKPGDVNNDNYVDTLDYSIIATNWGKSSGATRAMGDLGGPGGQPDGAVNLFDLSIMATNWAPRQL